jgi:D-alanyl-lipoteichoic acid acyltransferase DltB (MBOAT superfamily)
LYFNSYTFAVFCPIVLGLYWLLPHRRQNVLLVIASYVFYGAWDARFLLLMWFTTGVDYFVGRALEDNDDPRRRKRILSLSLAANLGVLGAFKYFNFFVGSGASLLRHVGLHGDVPTLRLIVPVGISFYTFHGISYTMDVYRRRVPAMRDPVVFAAFVSYFPQLVAGPIGRAEVQLPQFEHPRVRPDGDTTLASLTTILIGFAKKVLIADALAPYVNQLFGAGQAKGPVTLLLGAYAFSLQIYGDFSGYTDIARGVSQLFGISLLENFRQPYFSASITEFWQRWHISLSTWLRDYLYIPLGGNRGSTGETYRNLFLTMLIGGLWHGAAWTFVVWGAAHGALLVWERIWARRRRARAASATPPARWRHWLSVVVTFHLVTALWVFFRAPTLGAARSYFAGMAHPTIGTIKWSLLLTLILTGSLTFILDSAQARTGTDDALRRWSWPVRGSFVGVLFVLFLVFSGSAREPFIYFKF